jgi:hypothetical protein
MSQRKVSSDGSTLVDLDCHWIEISADPPPPNVKLQLINRDLGSATYGYYEKENNQFTHYAGLPKFQD